MRPFEIEHWGLIAYDQALDRQKRVVSDVIGGGPDRLIFCEHPPVLTLGRMTKGDSLLFDPETIAARGVAMVRVDRGGDVTLHAPGQLVVYVIMDLNARGRDLKAYLERLEQVAIDLLKDFGILAISLEGKRGVFVGRDKIVSIGIGVRKWVSYHGLGINVSTDLSLFRLIRPCGLDVRMTSIQQLTGHLPGMTAVEERFKQRFHAAFFDTMGAV